MELIIWSCSEYETEVRLKSLTDARRVHGLRERRRGTGPQAQKGRSRRSNKVLHHRVEDGPQTGNRRGTCQCPSVGARQLSGWSPASSGVGRPRGVPAQHGGLDVHPTVHRISGSSSTRGRHLPLGLWEHPTHGRYLPLTSACPARDALIKRHTKDHPATTYSQRSCVLARSGVSATSPRLWLAAPLTVTVQRARSNEGTMSDVLRTTSCCPSHQPPSFRIPSIPKTLGALT